MPMLKPCAFMDQRRFLALEPGLGPIGAMRDAADELDQIVNDAMRNRREQPWRLNSGE